jgi:hypothetical protein
LDSLLLNNRGLPLRPLIQKDGGIGPCDVLATGAIMRKVLLSTTQAAWTDKADGFLQPCSFRKAKITNETQTVRRLLHFHD